MHELLTPYTMHMWEHLDSLLVRITDLLQISHLTLGGIRGMELTHHVIIEDLLYGAGTTQGKTYSL
ncbi:hypothetical protein V8C35DRAFT_305587 [Trichoderma chlorosporum]